MNFKTYIAITRLCINIFIHSNITKQFFYNIQKTFLVVTCRVWGLQMIAHGNGIFHGTSCLWFKPPLPSPHYLPIKKNRRSNVPKYRIHPNSNFFFLLAIIVSTWWLWCKPESVQRSFHKLVEPSPSHRW